MALLGTSEESMNSLDIDLPLNIGTFNCRGLQKSRKLHSLFNTFKKQKLDIISLQETHMGTEEDILQIKNRWNGPFHYSGGTSQSGGLITLFNPNVFSAADINLIYVTDNILISSLRINKNM